MQMVVSGHRPQKLGGFGAHKLHKLIKTEIRREIKDLRPDIIIIGMALGTDQWVAEVAIDEDIPFIATLPFAGQDRKWIPRAREHYHWLLSKAARTIEVDREAGYISAETAPGVYHPSKMTTRNRWMVDRLKDGDVFLCVFRGGVTGGTADCLRRLYTEKNEKDLLIRVTVINPETLGNKASNPIYEDAPF